MSESSEWSEKELEEIERVFQVPSNVPGHIKEELTATLITMKTVAKTRKRHAPWTLDDFEVGCKLGSGKFGRVYLVRDVHCHLPFALKLMHKSEIVSCGAERQVLREIEIQSHLRHPNILTLHSYFDDARFIFLVLEYATKGDIYRYLRATRNGYFTSSVAAKYIFQIVSALQYCHERRVMHRDLKPENILLSENDTIKLSDFGWSVHAPSAVRQTFCGTLDYLPPEIVCHETYSGNVDNWCLGVLCYEFLTGSAPFETETQKATFERIRTLDYTFPDHINNDGRNLIENLLRLEAHKRLTLDQVKKHRFITKNYPEAI